MNNPHVEPPDVAGREARRIECDPPMRVHDAPSSRRWIEDVQDLISRNLGISIPSTHIRPDLYLLEEEKAKPVPGTEGSYWIVIGGGKPSITTKWWPVESYQRVVDHFINRIRFVQAGAAADHHPAIRNVIYRVGQTSIREFLRLIYHSQGVLCPVGAAMHVAAAFGKPCVVIAGGRDSPQREMYPTQQFLHTIGQLSCCRADGCSKVQVVPLSDVRDPCNRGPCERPVHRSGQLVAKCMSIIEPRDVCRSIERYIDNAEQQDTAFPQAGRLTSHDARERLEAAARALSPYPGGFDGRGVVIPGGGVKYFACSYVCINLLRHVGCTLPVELWHLGPGEMTDEMRKLIEPLGVACVDALEVRRQHPARILNGWELKPYAILHSRFREVLHLDADNVPVVDPTFLFDTPQYQAHGSIFWPDFGKLGPNRPIWGLAGIPYRKEPEFESGQIVVDKERCWGPLNLTMWLNEHSDFWYRHVHGDKETFHVAWRKLGIEYAMPSRPIERLVGVMCQHDFEGRRVFQHRNFAKWTLAADNVRIPGFLLEEFCLHALHKLDERWTTRPGREPRPRMGPEEEKESARLCGTQWLYRRIGHDERTLKFLANGTIGDGAAACEQAWSIAHDERGKALSIYGRDGATCVLRLDSDGRWVGNWLVHERMPVELIAI